MANQYGNGRNGAKPEEDRGTWRPQDENGAPPRLRRNLGDEERYARDRDYGSDRDLGAYDRDDRDDDRYMSRERERMGPHWDDRAGRWDDREGRQRSTEYYGQGQSGYAAGRYEGDRSYGSRNQRWRGDERNRDRDFDERFDGRSSEPWSPQDRDWSDEGAYGGYLGQGGQQMGYGYDPSRGRERSRDEGHPVRNQGGLYGQGGYNEGMYGRGGSQNRYGSQGYQGWAPSGEHTYSQGFASQPGGGSIRSHRGKGPVGYIRSDERIKEIVSEVLTEHHEIDATNIEIQVKSGEVTVLGTVDDRRQKRLVEDVIETVSGVKDVINQLRVGANRSRPVGRDMTSASTESSTSTSGNGSDKRHRA